MERGYCGTRIPQNFPRSALAFCPRIRYKRRHSCTLRGPTPRAKPVGGWRYLHDGDNDNGRSEEKNVAHEARFSPLRGRPEAADLCRGQGFGRTASPSSHRPQDRHVSGSSDPSAEGRRLIAFKFDGRDGPAIVPACLLLKRFLWRERRRRTRDAGTVSGGP